MARTIDHTKIAILYETVSGQCRKQGVITTTEIVDIDEVLAANPRLEAVIVPRAAMPGGDANEHWYRQQVATATGTPVFPHGADRAVLVDNATGEVVGKQNGIPASGAPLGFMLIEHMVADIGDIWNGSAFMRHYAAVHMISGLVTQTYLQDCTLPLPEPPDAMTQHVIQGKFTVGHTIPVKVIAGR